MTTEQLNEIRERCKKATPGPWTYEDAFGSCDFGPNPCPDGKEHEDESCHHCEFWIWDDPALLREPCVIDSVNGDGLSNQNADFISHAREDVPALLDRCEALERALLQYAKEDICDLCVHTDQDCDQEPCCQCIDGPDEQRKCFEFDEALFGGEVTP